MSSISDKHCDPGSHEWVLTYHRPWWKLFFRRYQMLCWHCDVHIDEPSAILAKLDALVYTGVGNPGAVMAPPGKMP